MWQEIQKLIGCLLCFCLSCFSEQNHCEGSIGQMLHIQKEGQNWIIQDKDKICTYL